MTSPHVCLVGQILVDVTLPAHGNPFKLRAGGIMHAARALWAIDCPYSLVYCAPAYLDDEIAEHAKEYAATSLRRLGVVSGCPNVVLIGEPKEAGPQGYEVLLRERQTCEVEVSELASMLRESNPSDILVFPGGFPLESLFTLVGESSAHIYIDANFEPATSAEFSSLGRLADTIILSTSSTVFLDRYGGSAQQLCDDLVGRYCERALLKENRGGSRLFSQNGVVQTAAQPRKIQHSVGVGDCFDAVLVALRHRCNDRAALAYAACISAEYASTTYPDVFKEASQAWLQVPEDEIVELSGNSLAWESRTAYQVYIAAPDFEHVDRRPLESAVQALQYHNFRPRLPVREHGQMGDNASIERRQSLCEADLQLLGDCELMLAVLLYDDPGTLIEIGIAVERGIPVIVYDPYQRADNLMLTQLPFLVSADLDEVITGLFTCASNLRNT